MIWAVKKSFRRWDKGAAQSSDDLQCVVQWMSDKGTFKLREGWRRPGSNLCGFLMGKSKCKGPEVGLPLGTGWGRKKRDEIQGVLWKADTEGTILMLPDFTQIPPNAHSHPVCGQCLPLPWMKCEQVPCSECFKRACLHYTCQQSQFVINAEVILR